MVVHIEDLLEVEVGNLHKYLMVLRVVDIIRFEDIQN